MNDAVLPNSGDLVEAKRFIFLVNRDRFDYTQ